MSIEFILPVEPRADLESAADWRATARVFTHKGEYMQGPIAITLNGHERYTIGVYSLLDDLNSAFVDVRKKDLPSGSASPHGADTAVPIVRVQPNGWNEGEIALVTKAVQETWRELGRGVLSAYDVYGYHDIRVGAGSGSSSALVQAAIHATAAEERQALSKEQLATIHGRVESGADPLHTEEPVVWATRLNLGRPVRPLGGRNPRFWAVTWSAGRPVRTSQVKFSYDDEKLLLWRVRWASLERAVRSGDDARVARLSAESALENQDRNPSIDIGLLRAAVTDFGALGFAVAHTGTYHTALFHHDAPRDVLDRYRREVAQKSRGGLEDGDVQVFSTAHAAGKRFSK